jgi:hypothetical protein
LADTATLQPTCPPSARPQELLAPGANAHGLRAAGARLDGAQRVLDVWLFRDPPAALADPSLWTLTPPPGGTPVPIAAAALQAAPAPHLELELSGLPDPARYRLQVAPPAAVPFDPLRTWLPVRLRPECPDLGSCFAGPPVRPTPEPSPVHDYSARDWRSLRRALTEYLLREDPEADLSVADPAIAYLELVAHLGDLLHYRLDRVATEAYLETARLRTSVRRHARLVDFPVTDGASAVTEVLVEVAPGAGSVDVLTGDAAVDQAGSDLAFTFETDLNAVDALSEIPIYDWGEEACCLPEGATECVLVRPRPADVLGEGWLEPGALLAFEVVDPDDAGRHQRWTRRAQDWPTDASGVERFREPLPSRRAQVVELTAVEPFGDPLLGGALELTLVRWRAEDALERSLPIGVDTGAGGEEVAVARANLVRAHHGRLVDGPPGTTLAPRTDPEAGPVVTYSMSEAAASGPRVLSLALDGSPRGLVVRVGLPSGLEVQPEYVPSLLGGPEGELAVVVDIEEHEPPLMRFRTGAVGLAPPLGSRVTAAYEVGAGSLGNVPANALRVVERNAAAPGLVPQWSLLSGVRVRNPEAARGGLDPLPLDDVRRDAPEAFAAELGRAVLPADHAAEAARSPVVERATSQRSWSGSWPLVTTVVDLAVEGAAAIDAEADLQAMLDDVRMLGTEAAVRSGTPVALFLRIEVCAAPGFDAEAQRRRILEVLRPGDEEGPGLFHPSRLQLGSAVYVSAVVAAVAALPGVDAVEVAEARRLNEPEGTRHELIALAADEVAILDDDPARPERGRLDVHVRGGG